MKGSDDTIVAVATAPGRGALAIVRVSGTSALGIVRDLVDPWPDEPRRATLARVYSGQREGAGPSRSAPELLDEAVVIHYVAPASFTGEDAVEIICHGGPIVAASITAAIAAAGARPAGPGEFTRRAVLNGKLDLLQAEAVGDLVDASTRASQRIALSQLDGGLSRRIQALRAAVLELEALAAYDIDFPEEDSGPVPAERILGATRQLVTDLDQLLASAPMGELVRAGAAVVIAGAPNVGKSSLFNALLGRRRAIVTDLPGTTRDALEAVTEAEGWPVRLIDTAGLRDAPELVERLGIEVSREYLEQAAVILVCGDSHDTLREALREAERISTAPKLAVRTKADLASPEERATENTSVWVSAQSGVGLRDLTREIARVLETAKGTLAFDAPIITRERHRHAIAAARGELEEFARVFSTASVPPVVAAVHLREATRLLEELIGAVDVEDVLDRVFAAFCVGK